MGQYVDLVSGATRFLVGVGLLTRTLLQLVYVEISYSEGQTYQACKAIFPPQYHTWHADPVSGDLRRWV